MSRKWRNILIGVLAVAVLVVLVTLLNQGLSGAVYTQTTDVEGEVNGLMTYDRKVIKMDEAKLREVNQRVIRSMPSK